ncbi:MAG: DUF3343 domain-containing protein [Oscillospiraceae bacterium]|jgi:hypothetical protein|nr:DUF3343 domain-containing protein [Oscillospiraceae bacterium]
MSSYVATFYTHLGALITNRNLGTAGLKPRMTPVPRKLSSSCGTCVRYEADVPRFDLMDDDLEAVYAVTDGGDFRRIEQE